MGGGVRGVWRVEGVRGGCCGGGGGVGGGGGWRGGVVAVGVGR